MLKRTIPFQTINVGSGTGRGLNHMVLLAYQLHLFVQFQCVRKYVSELRQVGNFIRLPRFSTTARIYKIVENCIRRIWPNLTNSKIRFLIPLKSINSVLFCTQFMVAVTDVSEIFHLCFLTYL